MNRRGFTLVELAVVTAVLAIMAAIALPRFYTAQLKAKRSEVETNLRGIGTAEMAYDAAHDVFVAAAANPGEPLGKNSWPWKDGLNGWDALSWNPDGEVFCSYMTNTFAGDTWTRAEAYCDVDADTQIAEVHYIVHDDGNRFDDIYPERF